MVEYVPLETSETDAETNITPRIPAWSLYSEKTTIKRDHLKKCLISMLPRFVRGFEDRKIGPTSYLDALRGYAACIVFFAHGWKNNNPPNWQQQPFILTFFSGAGMVALFFIISGYALSYRFLILIRKQEPTRLLNALASSTFRRYIRLYGSSVAATLICVPFIRLGLFGGHPSVKNSLHKETFIAQLLDWTADAFHFCNPFASISGWPDPHLFDTKYLGQLWSIPVEYRGSVALFAYCTAICKMSTRNRMITTWAIIVVCFIWQVVYISEFFLGLFIADVALSRNPERLTSSPLPTENTSRRQTERLSTTAKVGYVLLFILGFFLNGQPYIDTLGVLGPYPWRLLKRLIPSWWDHSGDNLLWSGVGSFLLMWALEFYPTLQKPLQWRFSQYIGDLSFGIYAMHVLALGVYLATVIPLQVKYLGTSAPARYIPGIPLTCLFVLILADYFHRVDKSVVRFARWLETRLFTEFN